MKSQDVRHNKTESRPDLLTTSYSPTLRVLVVAAIFLIAVFLLAACGSKAKTASSATTPTQSAVTTSSPSPTATNAALTCNADKSSDSIDVGKYFGKILDQVRTQWKKDAVISSVRFERQYVSNFQDLCTLKTDSNWQIVFYSLSGKNEISGYLDNSKKDAAGVPPVIFEVDSPDGLKSNSLTFADMQKQGGWVLHEFSRPETYKLEVKYAANLFAGWKLSMSDVVQKLIDRVRNEKISSLGFHIYIGKASLETKSPYVSLYWQNAPKRTSFYVEPVTLKTYDQAY